MEGVELLKKSKQKIQIPSELPTVFSVFMNNYETGRNGFKIKYFKHNDDLIQLSSVTYLGDNNYENSISHFLDSPELEVEIKRYKDGIDDYYA